MESDQRRYELREEVRDFLAPHGFLEPEHVTEVISIVVKHLNDWLRDAAETARDAIDEDADPITEAAVFDRITGLRLAQSMAQHLAQAPAKRIRKVLSAH